MKNHAALAKSYSGGQGIAQKGPSAFAGSQQVKDGIFAESKVDNMPTLQGGTAMSATRTARGPAMGG